MKSLFVTLFAASALVLSARADEVKATISNVHICCGKCVTGAENAVGSVSGAKAAVDKDAHTVVITAPDQATAQKAADALIAAGYFGTTSDAGVKIDGSTGAQGKKVQKLQVNGVHLCCAKCVKAVDETLKAVPGVTGDTAAKGAKSFDVTGDFNDQDVMAALQKAGFTGKVN